MLARRILCILVPVSACAELADLGPERGLEERDASHGVTDAAGSGGVADAAGTGGGAGGAVHVGNDSGAAETGPGGAEAGASDACTVGGVHWIKHFGDSALDVAYAVAEDGQGGVFVAGIFSGQLDLGGPPLTSAGGTDIFLARFDGDGNHVWSKRFGDTSDEALWARLTRTPDGVILAGGYAGVVDFGEGPRSAENYDGFVARFAENGDHAWTHTFDGPDDIRVQSVAVNRVSGAFVVAGLFQGVTDLGEGAVTSAGRADGFLVELDGASGAPVWSQHFGTYEQDSINWLAVDPQGRIVLGGATAGPIDLGEGALPYTTGNDAFIGVYDATGVPIWTRSFGGPGEQDLRRLAIDPMTGDLVIAGALYWGSTSFGGGLIEAYDRGTFLARLSMNAGEHVASKSVDNLAAPEGLVVDSAGSIVVGGLGSNVISFGSEPTGPSGGWDGIVAKLGPEFEPIWTLRFGSLFDDATNALALDADANVFAVGHFRSSVTFGSCAPLQSAGDADMLLMKLAP